MKLKLVIIPIISFLFCGCATSSSFYNQEDALLKHNITEEQMCSMITKNEVSWNPEKRKCNTQVTNDIVKDLILFKLECDRMKGNIKIISELTTCNIFNDLYIVYDKAYSSKFMDVADTIDESRNYKTIKEICQYFPNSSYDEQNRSCKFTDNIPFKYLLLEKLVRNKDTQEYQKEQQVLKKSELQWGEEAKNWKGSLDDLCEQLTDSKRNFNEKTLDCKTFYKAKIPKYDYMKTLLVEQHKRITEEREKLALQKAKEEKILIEKYQQKWENRVGKATKIREKESYSCESYSNKFMFYIPTNFKLDMGYSSIQIQNFMTFHYIDSFKDYDLYEGYKADYTMYKLKIYKNKLLETTPYNMNIEGVGYFCSQN